MNKTLGFGAFNLQKSSYSNGTHILLECFSHLFRVYHVTSGSYHHTLPILSYDYGKQRKREYNYYSIQFIPGHYLNLNITASIVKITSALSYFLHIYHHSHDTCEQTVVIAQ